MTQDLVNPSFIETELKKFTVTDSAIEKMAIEYMPLKINNFEDKEGYKIVSTARKTVKGYRVEVDHKRKELIANALEFQRRINGEAKRITGLLEPIESYLEKQEKEFDAEIERVKAEKERQLIEFRSSELIKYGLVFNGIYWKADFITEGEKDNPHVRTYMDMKSIKEFSNEEFNGYLLVIKDYYDKNIAYKEELKKSEEARILAEALKEIEMKKQQEIEREKQRIELEIKQEEMKRKEKEIEESHRILKEKEIEIKEQTRILEENERKALEALKEKQDQERIEKVWRDPENALPVIFNQSSDESEIKKFGETLAGIVPVNIKSAIIDYDLYQSLIDFMHFIVETRSGKLSSEDQHLAKQAQDLANKLVYKFETYV